MGTSQPVELCADSVSRDEQTKRPLTRLFRRCVSLQLRGFAMFEFGRSDDERSSAALVRPTPVRSSGERMMPYRRISAFFGRGNPAAQSKNIRHFLEGVSSDWLRRCEGNGGQLRIVHDKAT
jgi:hypothetical protein